MEVNRNELHVYSINENEHIGAINLPVFSYLGVIPIVILGYSSTVGDAAERFVKEVLPLVMSKIKNWGSVKLIDFGKAPNDKSLFESLSQFNKKTEGVVNIGNAIEKLRLHFESFSKSTNYAFDVLTISIGEIIDSENAELEAKKLTDYLAESNWINSQAVRLLTTASNQEPNTRALSYLLQINNLTEAKICDISATSSNDTIANEIAALFPEYAWAGFKSTKQLISRFPWRRIGSEYIRATKGWNVFCLTELPTTDRFDLLVDKWTFVNVIIEGQLTLEKFQQLMERQLPEIVSLMKILKIVGTTEANESVDKIFSYFVKTEEALAVQCSTPNNKFITNALAEIATYKPNFRDSAEMMKFYRSPIKTIESQREEEKLKREKEQLQKQAEEKRRKQAEDERLKQAEKERLKREQDERHQREEDVRQRRQEAEEKRLQQAEEERLQQAEKERLNREQEERLKQEQEERHQREEEARQKLEEEELEKQAEEERFKQAEEERLKREQEERHQRQEEELEKQAEEDKRRQRKEEDKLLNKLEESEPEPPSSQEDECVICINAKATMQTSPCGHRVVCRRCFVKTIQSAVAQRLLPLRCVICRARVNRLTSGSGTWRIQESASSYSMGTNKSWSTLGSSPSSYSVGAGRVAQSTSLYSMSSGSSCISGNSSISNSSNSSTQSGVSSVSSKTNATDNLHRHHGSCSSGCSGAIPRNSQYGNKRYGHHQSKGRLSELQNRLPPIKEFRSPTKVPMPSPTHLNNPKLRFASYTQKPTAANENIPLLEGPTKTVAPKPGISSKVAPMNVKSPINTMNMAAGKDHPIPSTSRGLILFSNSCSKSDERADNRKNENTEKKKKEEKLKQKAEKDARKEEKRLAKEEERLAKLLAKEEKKKGKREAKELLISDGRRK